MKVNEKIQQIEKELSSVLVERQEEIRGLSLALLSKTNMLLLGSAGIAKSMLVKLWSNHLSGAKYFDTLITAFSTPEELFGPYSLAKLEEDKYERHIDGMLPTAHFVFLDEVFKGNSGILNALLELMNERTFRNGVKKFKTEVLCLVGASNEIPSSGDGLDAFYDRFLLKFLVQPVREPGNFIKMLKTDTEVYQPSTRLTFEELKNAQEQVQKVMIPETIFDTLLKIRIELYNKGFSVTDRTFKHSLKILQAEAWLNGRNQVEEQDLDVLKHIYWTDPTTIRSVYLALVNTVSADRGKILTILDECKKIVDELFEEKDLKVQTQKGLEVANRLKESRTEIQKLINEMAKKGLNTAKTKNVLNEMDALIKRVFLDACGINF